ncbi:MAG: hypothetical protein K9J48_04370 [Desulfohalobiaceae bacterium]|nr:hypothetical protein [Desulfohalobiaceae bacterium]
MSRRSRTSQSLKRLGNVARQIASLDNRVLEVFIHSEVARDPLENDEVHLVCHLADHAISNDLDRYNDEGYLWGLEMQERISQVLAEEGIENEVIITPFNFRLHEDGEYGSYYHTLYLREGFTPVVELADRKKQAREQEILKDSERSE